MAKRNMVKISKETLFSFLKSGDADKLQITEPKDKANETSQPQNDKYYKMQIQ